MIACVLVVGAVLLSAGCSTAGRGAASEGGLKWGAGYERATRASSARRTFTPSLYLSRLIIAEQQESREQFRRLAEGQIKRFTVSDVTTVSGRYIVHMTADIAGLGAEPFDAVFMRYAGGLYLLATTQGSPLAAIGGIGPAETALGEDIQRDERKWQKAVRELVGNKIAYIEVLSVHQELDRSVVDCVAHMRDGKTHPCAIEMRRVNEFWYAMSLRTVRA